MTGTALYGRDAEFAVLGAVLGDACAGGAGVALVAGAG